MAEQPIDTLFRNYETDGVPSSGPHKPTKGDIRDTFNVRLPPAPQAGDAGKQLYVKSDESGYEIDEPVARSAPLVILATGQSNMNTTRSLTWTPPENLLVWNNINNDVDSVGTAFAAPSGTIINTALAFANKIAQANPGRTVYLVNCSRSSQPISQWMTGAAAPDVYANIQANMPPALIAADVEMIDRLLWWQGEAGGTDADYPADWETVIARFQAEDWFSIETPVTVFDVINPTDGGSSSYLTVTSNLQAVVGAEPAIRQFVDLSMLTGGTYWALADLPHMTAEGYLAAGTMAANIALGGGSGLPFGVDVPVLPRIDGLTSAGVGTYSAQTARIWRNGKRVDFAISLTWTAHTGTGGMVIAGPFPAPYAGLPFAVTLYMSSITYTGVVFGRLLVSGSEAQIQLLQMSSNAASAVIPMDTAGTVLASGFYYVN